MTQKPTRACLPNTLSFFCCQHFSSSSYTNCAKQQRDSETQPERTRSTSLVHVKTHEMVPVNNKYRHKHVFGNVSCVFNVCETASRPFVFAKYLQGSEGLTHPSCSITKDEISMGGISVRVSRAAQSSLMITPFWKNYKAKHPAWDEADSSISAS